jgi:hypothetical protein
MIEMEFKEREQLEVPNAVFCVRDSKQEKSIYFEKDDKKIVNKIIGAHKIKTLKKNNLLK